MNEYIVETGLSSALKCVGLRRPPRPLIVKGV